MSMPSSTAPAKQGAHRNAAMKDSWSHGDDRRDRGRSDRGAARPHRARSPAPSSKEADQDSTAAARTSKSGSTSRPRDRHRDHSTDRRRSASNSPVRETREEVRERNRGRELFDFRPDKPRRSGRDEQDGRARRDKSPHKRRKSRSPSAERSRHKKSRRHSSRSPDRHSRSPRSERKSRHGTSPRRRRDSRERDTSSHRPSRRKDRRPSEAHRRGRSRSASKDQARSPRRKSPRRDSDIGRRRTPPTSPGRRLSRRRSSSVPPKDESFYKEDNTDVLRTERKDDRREDRRDDRRRRRSRSRSPRSPGRGRHDSRSRLESPRPSKASRETSPRGRDRDRQRDRARDQYSHSPVKESATEGVSKASNSGVTPQSGADNMSGRGNYNGQPGYYYQGPNAPSQGGYPMKQPYPGDPMQVDTHQYSLPQVQGHHGSPQAQSPYGAGRGGWANQPQFSPTHQYAGGYPQAGFTPPTGPANAYYQNQAQSQSPPYPPANGSVPQNYPQQQFQSGGRGFRGNGFVPRGPSGNNARGRGGSYQNQWNDGQGRGQHVPTGPAADQMAYSASAHGQSPPPPPPPPPPPAEEPDDDDNPFRPSKDLQVEDDNKEKKDDKAMPPPPRAPPTGPQGSKFSFAFKSSSKPTATPKPEIAQVLNAAPTRPAQPNNKMQTHGSSITIPTGPGFKPSGLQPLTRKVKKTMKRQLPRPILPTEFATSESVYYRKPGNESVVGSGTYGKVFKAIHVYTKNLVALKRIRMEGERDGFPVTAVREIKLLQSLKHENVVKLQEVMVERNDCFMVFEYLSHDLTGLLNHPTFKLEPAHKKHLAMQMFQALDYLHRKGVLHRDIKAANILVSNDGQLKLADFGLARFYVKRKSFDYTNRVVTIWYRSPELLFGETQYGPAVDIWSAACVLVEIFTRHAIFPGDGGEINQLEKIYAVLGTPTLADWPALVEMAWFELLRPNTRRPNVFADKYKDRVTPAAFELLEAMFHFDPAKRPSAAEVLEHPYFKSEEPAPKQAVELQTLDGDWHEFESKALRKENERKEKEARRQQRESAKEREAEQKEKGKKRPADDGAAEPDGKRRETDGSSTREA